MSDGPVTVIATDEAGYGPRLGPLVIVATRWRIERPGPGGGEGLSPCFARFLNGFDLPGLGTVRLIDSKKLYRATRYATVDSGLGVLEAIVRAALASLPTPQSPRSVEQLLRFLAPQDAALVMRQPWLADLSRTIPSSAEVDIDAAPLAAALTLAGAAASVTLQGVSARVIDARRFNQLCTDAGNKATLLSEATVQLAAEQIAAADTPEIHLYSDRHGGRARYAGMLQQHSEGALVQIVREGPRESCYRLEQPGRTWHWRFTVGGDSFPPVALASIFAKYLRERCMEAFNGFWSLQHRQRLLPTAGYSSDAARFLRDIDLTLQRLKIDRQWLVRAR